MATDVTIPKVHVLYLGVLSLFQMFIVGTFIILEILYNFQRSSVDFCCLPWGQTCTDAEGWLGPSVCQNYGFLK